VSRPAALRAVAAVAGGWGLLLATRPADVLALLTPPGSRPDHGVVRLLGVRSTLQALVLAVRPVRAVALGAAGVDALHAASMGAAALVWPRYRRAALASGAVAAVTAVATRATAGKVDPPRRGKR
jgi:hypothetical protein